MSNTDTVFNVKPDSESVKMGASLRQSQQKKAIMGKQAEQMFEETPLTVGDVHPRFGVRMKKNLNAKSSRFI